MPTSRALDEAVVATWRTNNRVTVFFVEHLPAELWAQQVPGAPRRTVRMILGHIHNARCMWIKMLGAKLGIAVPKSVKRQKVTRSQLLPALERSSAAVVRLIELGVERGGKFPGFPQDVGHFMAYLTAHEGHHRGQVCMIARQTGHRLSQEVTAGLWQWSKRAREAGRG
jgi:uncharacterized damage-inducible protein DinB